MHPCYLGRVVMETTTHDFRMNHEPVWLRLTINPWCRSPWPHMTNICIHWCFWLYLTKIIFLFSSWNWQACYKFAIILSLSTRERCHYASIKLKCRYNKIMHNFTTPSARPVPLNGGAPHQLGKLSHYWQGQSLSTEALPTKIDKTSTYNLPFN